MMEIEFCQKTDSSNELSLVFDLEIENMRQNQYQFCEIPTLLYLSYVVSVKSKVEISQNFVAFSEYMNFTRTDKDKTLQI